MHDTSDTRAPLSDGPAGTAADAPAQAPGRSCPLHYRYGPTALARAPDAGLDDLDVLYVVGGLYGNVAALARLLDLFDAEPGRKALVFNGDFHWFDTDPAVFARVQAGVMAHHALRGNVETELAADADAADDAPDAGCGCAYPAWVGDAVVERSNRILRRLRGALAAQADAAAIRAALAALPMHARARVGPLQIAIVHGDAESLAGWGFAQEHLQDADHRARLAGWFDAAGVQVFASSHTCLPVTQAWPGGRWLLNNGAAGMPNFRGEPAGLFTRIATRPCEGPARRYGVCEAGVHLDTVAIDADPAAALAGFLAQWPAGSDAHASYHARIVHGPDYTPGQAIRTRE